METVQVPFHFISTFLVTIAAAGGLWVSLQRPEFGPAGRLPRLGFAAGWALLATGEMVHGALVAPDELGPSVVALRAGAYAFLVMSLLPARRTTGAAAAAASGSQALMPSFLAFAASFFISRSRLVGARRLAIAVGLLGASEVLFGLGGAGAGVPAGVAWYTAHGVRLAGAIAVGAWLWGAFKTSIQIRFIAAFVGLLLLVVVALSSAMTQVFSANIRRNALEQSALEGRSQEVALGEQRDELIRLAKLAAGLPGLREGVAKVSPTLVDSARAFQAPGGLFEALDFMAFFDQSGAILAISAAAPGGGEHLDESERIGLAGTEVVQVSLQQRIEAGSIDAIGQKALAVIAAAPVFNPPGLDPPGAPQGLAGSVAVGVVIDLDYLASLAGEALQFSAITSKQILVSTLIHPAGLLDTDLRPVFERGEVVNVETAFGGIEFFSSYIPLERTDRQVVGALVVSRPSEVLALTQQNVGRTLFAIALVAAAIAVGSSYFTGSRITRPIVELTGAARRVREGDLEARALVGGSDEVGTLGETFNEMVASIGRLTGDLRSAATQLETILQSLTDGVVAVDDQGQVVAFNREAERITGQSQELVRGKRIDQVLRATDDSGRPIFLPVHRLEAGAVGSAFVTADGSRMTPVAITSAPIRAEDGALAGAVAVVHDMTSEIALEKAKTEFLANISHELNTPLTPIKGYAEMLRHRKVPRGRAVPMLDGIIASTGRLKRIVDMLIDVSSMEAGRLTVRRERHNLEKVTAEIVDRWKKSAPKHRFERRGFRKLPPVEIDPRLIPRAIDELIDNAVKFSPRGGRISLTAQLERSRGGTNLRISVADQGIGISKDKLAGIWGEFTQVDASETRAYGGLGLGLAYVRRIVDTHRGVLEVSSVPNKGSRFSIVLSIARRRAPAGKGVSTSARDRPITKRRT